ncbi:MAG: hypothetical protein FJ293_05240 [Planctomycetes bacterium]|nr:hypothetical protein [Planctomycetota bacterium]
MRKLMTAIYSVAKSHKPFVPLIPKVALAPLTNHLLEERHFSGSMDPHRRSRDFPPRPAPTSRRLATGLMNKTG